MIRVRWTRWIVDASRPNLNVVACLRPCLRVWTAAASALRGPQRSRGSKCQGPREVRQGPRPAPNVQYGSGLGSERQSQSILGGTMLRRSSLDRTDRGLIATFIWLLIATLALTSLRRLAFMGPWTIGGRVALRGASMWGWRVWLGSLGMVAFLGLWIVGALLLARLVRGKPARGFQKFPLPKGWEIRSQSCGDSSF